MTRLAALRRSGPVLAGLPAAVLVALLVVVVVDGIQSRRDADGRADRALSDMHTALEELQRRGDRIDVLNQRLAEQVEAREELSEQVRALRELLIDMGALEPRPAEQPPARSSSSRPAPQRTPAPQPQPPSTKPSPQPSPSPSPSPTPCTVRNPLTGECLIPGANARSGGKP